MQGVSHCTKQGFPQQTSPVASSHSFHTTHEMNQQTPNAPLQCHVLSTAEMNPSDATTSKVTGTVNQLSGHIATQSCILPQKKIGFSSKKKKELCFCKYFELTFLAENKSLLSINLWPSSLPLLVPITVLSFHFCAYSWDITAIAICEQNPHPVLSKAEHTCTHNYCSLSKVLALQKWHDHNSRHQEISDCLVMSPWDWKYHQVSISFSEITFKLETPLKHPCSQAKMDILDLAHIPEELPTCSLWPFPGAGRGQHRQVEPADSGPIPAWMVRGLKSLTRQHNSSAAVFEHALSFCPNQGWNHGHSEHQSSPVCCNRLSFCNCLSDRSWLN